MPLPRKNEKQKEYISRCVAFVMHEGKTDNPSQAAAMCYSMFKKWRKERRKESDIALILKVGTAASGNYGHEGIIGHRGGSKPRRGKIRITPQKPMQPSVGGDKQGNYETQWELSTTSEQTKKAIANFKKNGIEKVILEFGANGSYVDISNTIVNDLFKNHPYVKKLMVKEKIFEFQITGNKLLDGNLVGFYADDILMLSKKGIDLSHKSIQKNGIDVVEGVGDRPFSSSNAIAHEIGHHLVSNDKKINASFMSAWEKNWNKERKNPKFTEYGSNVDSEEGFAEAFALYTNIKGRSRLLPDTVSFMKWYLGEGKKKKKELGLMLMFKHSNHPAMGPKHRSSKIDIASYKKMSAQAKVKVLKSAIKSYTENYVPKAKQTRILNKLSKKGKTQWLESNKRIGQLEGMRRAMIARGDSSSRIEQRKNYHFSIKLQEQAAKVKGDMKKYKSLGLLSYFK